MKYSTRSSRRHLLLAVAATSALAMGIAKAPPALAAGNLTMGQALDPGNLDPIDTFLLAWGAIGSNVFDGLVYRSADIELSPGLATKWEFMDDDKRIRFTLREGVTFHNGEPFNAEAVKYTFDRLLGDEGAKGPQRSNYTSIESIEIVDDLTVDFVLAKPDPVLITKLAGYGAMIVPPKYIEEVGQTAFDKTPVGTGPYRVVKYTPSVSVELESYDEHWRGKPGLDTLTYQFIPEASTRVAELLSGGVDVISTIPASLVDSIKNSENAELIAVSGPTVQSLRLRTQDAITEDVRVRRALNMAIDRNAIIDSLLQGYATPIQSLQTSKSFGFDPDLAGYDYDPETAKSLLEAAGVEPGAQMSIDFFANDANFREIAQAIAGYLSIVGIQAKLNPIETTVMLNDIIPNGKTSEMYQFNWGGWTFDFDNTAYLIYHSGERWNPYGTSDLLDKLLEEQRNTFDQEKREDILQQIAAYAKEEAYDVPLFGFDTLYGVGKNVKNFTPAPDDRMFFYDTSITE